MFTAMWNRPPCRKPPVTMRHHSPFWVTRIGTSAPASTSPCSEGLPPRSPGPTRTNSKTKASRFAAISRVVTGTLGARCMRHRDHPRQFDRDRMIAPADGDGDRSTERRLRADRDPRARAHPHIAEILEDLGQLFGDAADGGVGADLQLRERYVVADGIAQILGRD